MKSACQIFSVCLVAFVAVVLHARAAAAEDPVVAQDLVNVRASTSIAAALWTRRQDSYTLQVAFPAAIGCGTPAPRANPAVGVTVEQPREAAREAQTLQTSQNLDRASFFIGNTIANLRDLDPTFGCRTLTLIDGRRVIPATSPPVESRASTQTASDNVNVSEALLPLVPRNISTNSPVPRSPPATQVWLLRADGSQVAPVEVVLETSKAYGCRTNCPVSAKQYRFALNEGAQAVAVAISVDDEYYIEKLKPLAPDPAP